MCGVRLQSLHVVLAVHYVYYLVVTLFFISIIDRMDNGLQLKIRMHYHMFVDFQVFERNMCEICGWDSFITATLYVICNIILLHS